MTHEPQQPDLATNKLRQKKLIQILPLLIIIGISLFIRIYLPWEVSIADGFIKIAADDAPYHLRLIENTVRNFPQRIYFDPFVFYHDYIVPYVAPLFTWLGSSFAFLLQFLFFGGGIPGSFAMELSASLLPAIGGTLIVYLCYLCTLLLFSNRNMALLSSLILATMPGQFLSRTLFGFADHHFLETLFSLLAFLFLIKSLKEITNIDRQLEQNSPASVKRLAFYSLCGGLSLVLYLLAWVGAAFLLPIILIFWLLAFGIRHLEGKNTSLLFISGFFFLLPPLLVSFFLRRIPGLTELFTNTLILPLLFALLIILGLYYLAKIFNLTKLPRISYFIALILLMVGGLLLINLPPFDTLAQGPLQSMRQVFFPSGQLATVSEAQPMFFANRVFSLASAWSNFTTSLFFGFIALLLLTILALKNKSYPLIFFVIWSWYMLLATSSQNRFAYYLAVNMAILSGYLGVKIVEYVLVYLKGLLENGKAILGVISSYQLLRFLFYLWLLVLLVYPNLLITTYWASRGLGTHPDWYESLNWLKENTPDPGLDYFALYETPKEGENFQYPAGSYSVMSWWDFGYLIAYYGKRMPVANPGGFGVGANSEVRFVDMNQNGEFQTEEPLIVDLDFNGIYTEGDLLLSGNKPEVNTKLSRFNTSYLYWDYHQDQSFNPLEPLIHDKDNNFLFSSGDEILYGSIVPPTGSKLRFISMAPGAAPFFAATDLKTANDILKYYNTRYIITSLSMATNKFWAMAELGGEGRQRFISDFLLESVSEAGVEIKPVKLYLPEFYQTMIARLHFFKGEEVVPNNSTWVISYEAKIEGGVVYRIINNEWLFQTYEAAKEFIDQQNTGNFMIVGKSPHISPVPLEKITNLKIVYETINTVLRFNQGDRQLRGIIIFENLSIK